MDTQEHIRSIIHADHEALAKVVAARIAEVISDRRAGISHAASVPPMSEMRSSQ